MSKQRRSVAAARQEGFAKPLRLMAHPPPLRPRESWETSPVSPPVTQHDRYNMNGLYYDGSTLALRKLCIEFEGHMRNLTNELPSVVITSRPMAPLASDSLPSSKRQQSKVRKDVKTQLGGITPNAHNGQANEDIDPYADGLDQNTRCRRSCLTTGFAISERLEQECASFPKRVLAIEVVSIRKICEMHGKLEAKMIGDFPFVTLYADEERPPAGSTRYLNAHFPAMPSYEAFLGNWRVDPSLRQKIGLKISEQEMKYLGVLVQGEYTIHQIAASFARKAATFLSATSWPVAINIVSASSHLYAVFINVERSLFRFEHVSLEHGDRRCLLIAMAALHLVGASLQLVMGFLHLAVTQPVGTAERFNPSVLQPVLTRAGNVLVAAWEQICQLTDPEVTVDTKRQWLEVLTVKFGIFATVATSALTAAWRFYKVLQSEASKIKVRTRSDKSAADASEYQRVLTKYVTGMLQHRDQSEKEAENWCRQRFPNAFDAWDADRTFNGAGLGGNDYHAHSSGAHGNADILTPPRDHRLSLGGSLFAAAGDFIASWAGELAQQLAFDVRR